MQRPISQLGELELWVIIEQVGNQRRELEQQAKAGKDNLQEKLDECKDWQRKAIEQLTRFGVEHPYKDGTKKASEEYWKWCRWWRDYLDGIPDEEAAEIQRRLSEQQDVSEFRPEGDWR